MRDEYKENDELIERYANGDKSALNEIVENNKKLVFKIANKYNIEFKGVELEDIQQEGFVGLIKAANSYDVNREHKTTFVTYAFNIINQTINYFVNGRTSKDKGNTKFYRETTSIDSPIGDDEDTQLSEIIGDDDKNIELVEEKIYMKKIHEELRKVLKGTTLARREAIKMYYGFDSPRYSQQEIGEILGKSQQAVRGNIIDGLLDIRRSPLVNGLRYDHTKCYKKNIVTINFIDYVINTSDESIKNKSYLWTREGEKIKIIKKYI